MSGSFVSVILNKLILEFKKEENMTRVQKEVVDPLIQYGFKRLSPYIIVTFILFLLTFILALLILLILIKNNLKLSGDISKLNLNPLIRI